MFKEIQIIVNVMFDMFLVTYQRLNFRSKAWEGEGEITKVKMAAVT